MKRRLILAATASAAALLALGNGVVTAAQPEIFTGLVEGTGSAGYDVVAYFSGAPVPGNAAYSTEWKGAKWLFSSAENLAAFQAAPEKYAPQYGGYCAYAVAKGYTAKGDPEAWSVVDGRLYLNYSKSVRDTWSKDIPGHIAAGNANWPDVLN